MIAITGFEQEWQQCRVPVIAMQDFRRELHDIHRFERSTLEHDETAVFVSVRSVDRTAGKQFGAVDQVNGQI